MYGFAKKPDYRRNWRQNTQEYFDTSTPAFQKTPITILEELFPNRTVYTWAVSRNRGCADLFKCRVRVPTSSGESISFSKKIAKHQAALEALKNLQKYGTRDMANFISSYVCGGSSIMFLRNRNRNLYNRQRVDFNYNRNSRCRSRSRSHSRARSMSRARSRTRYENENNRRSRSCSRSRGRSYSRDMNGSFLEAPGPHRPKTSAVSFLEEECKLCGLPGPEYSPAFRGTVNGDFVVYATLGPFTSEGFGPTRERARQASAAALIDSFFVDGDN